MTQTDIPTWCLNFQLKLMAALDAAWAILDTTDDPAEIRRARDKAKAIGDLAAMARKVALITPSGRPKPPATLMTDAAAAGLAATQGVANVRAMLADSLGRAAPDPAPAAQAEHARRALDKLKGGRRGRL
jgi:hypothetical protein